MDREHALTSSWEKNAGNWTRAVREGLIASRKAGTDAAIVDAVVENSPNRLLDVGCGEGWLVRRAVALTGCVGVGVDGSERLISDARCADPEGSYEAVSYDCLITAPEAIGEDFDVIVFNYALLDERAGELLSAVKRLLTSEGVILIQTLHPWAATVQENYRNGWREEDFTAFEGQDWAPMPWYFRTMASWHDVVRGAGLVLDKLSEPVAGPDGPPLSLLLTCRHKAT